jgi:hypothetical protein
MAGTLTSQPSYSFHVTPDTPSIRNRICRKSAAKTHSYFPPEMNDDIPLHRAPVCTDIPAWSLYIILTCCILICLVCMVVYCLVYLVAVVLGLLLLCCCTMGLLLLSYVYYVRIAVCNLDAGLLTRSQYPEGPATGHRFFLVSLCL